MDGWRADDVDGLPAHVVNNKVGGVDLGRGQSTYSRTRGRQEELAVCRRGRRGRPCDVRSLVSWLNGRINHVPSSTTLQATTSLKLKHLL